MSAISVAHSSRNQEGECSPSSHVAVCVWWGEKAGGCRLTYSRTHYTNAHMPGGLARDSGGQTKRTVLCTIVERKQDEDGSKEKQTSEFPSPSSADRWDPSVAKVGIVVFCVFPWSLDVTCLALI